MKNISHYFERWSRNSSSQALENDFKSQGEKRAKIVDRYRWQHSDLNALEMAKDIMPENDSILSIVSVELWAYKWRETLKRKFTAIKKKVRATQSLHGLSPYPCSLTPIFTGLSSLNKLKHYLTMPYVFQTSKRPRVLLFFSFILSSLFS